MNEDQVAGTAKRSAGAAQGTAGHFLDDTKMRVEGAAREVAGRAQEAYGEARERARDAAAQVGRGVEQQPMSALLIAGAVGFALGALATRRGRR